MIPTLIPAAGVRLPHSAPPHIYYPTRRVAVNIVTWAQCPLVQHIKKPGEANVIPWSKTRRMAGATARDTLHLVSLQPHLLPFSFIDHEEDRSGCGRPRECGCDHDHTTQLERECKHVHIHAIHTEHDPGHEGEQGGEEEDEVRNGRVASPPTSLFAPRTRRRFR